MHWQGAYQHVMTRFIIGRYLNSRKIKNPILFHFNKEGILLIITDELERKELTTLLTYPYINF